jgi:hypothetical protein
MTTVNEAKEAVYSRFVANYTGVASNLITFDNEEFEEPDSDDWIRLTVRGIGRSQSSLGKTGNRRFRSTASVFVQIYVLVNTGIQQADLLAKEAADVFEGTSFSGLDFREASINEIGPDGKWYQTLVEAPFDYDEIK